MGSSSPGTWEAEARAATRLIQILGDGEMNGASTEEPWSVGHWDAIYRLAEEQHLLPYLDWKLTTRANAEYPPDPIAQKMRRARFRYSSRSLWLYTHLHTILRALQQAQIPVILLKGAYLGSQVYANMYLRPMADIDLLIQERQLLDCDEVLIHMGYYPSRKAWIQGDYRQAHHHLPPHRHAWMPPIEIHWNIAPTNAMLRVIVPSLWEQAVPCRIEDVSCLGLSPEHLIIHLCLHAGYSNRFRGGLRPLIDLQEVIRKFGEHIDWAEVFRQAEAWGATKCLGLMLALAEKTFPAKAYRLEPARQIIAQVPEQMIQIARARLWEAEGFSPHFAELLNAEGMTSRVRILWQRTFPPVEVMAARYAFHPQSPKRYIYYILRLIELLQRYMRTLFTMRLGHPKERAGAEREIALSAWLHSPQ